MTRPLAGHPRRRGIPRVPRHVIRVLTEGKITEPDYLTKWARLNRRNVRLEIGDSGMTPDALVRRAKGVREAETVGRNVRTRSSTRSGAYSTRHQRRGLQSMLRTLAGAALGKSRLPTSTAVTSNSGRTYFNSLPTSGFCPWQSLSSSMPLTWQSSAPERSTDGTPINGSPPRSNPSTDAWRLVDRLRAGMQGGPT